MKIKDKNMDLRLVLFHLTDRYECLYATRLTSTDNCLLWLNRLNAQVSILNGKMVCIPRGCRAWMMEGVCLWDTVHPVRCCVVSLAYVEFNRCFVIALAWTRALIMTGWKGGLNVQNAAVRLMLQFVIHSLTCSSGWGVSKGQIIHLNKNVLYWVPLWFLNHFRSINVKHDLIKSLTPKCVTL